MNQFKLRVSKLRLAKDKSAARKQVFLNGMLPANELLRTRACKCGPLSNNTLFKLFFSIIWFNVINFVLSPCITFWNNQKILLLWLKNVKKTDDHPSSVFSQFHSNLFYNSNLWSEKTVLRELWISKLFI